MNKTKLLAGCVLVLAALGTACPVRAEEAPSAAKLGKPIGNLQLKDSAGKPFALHDLKDKKAIVVVFMSFECPMSTGYSQTLATMAKAYGMYAEGPISDPGDLGGAIQRGVERVKKGEPVLIDVVTQPR